MRISMVGRSMLQNWWLFGAFVLLSLVVLNPSTARAGDTLVEFTVPNNEFEIVPPTGSTPPNWSYYSAGLQSGLSLSDTVKFSGLRSMRFVKTPPPPPPATPSSLGAESEKLDVAPGNVYEATVKLKIENFSGSPELWIRWYDSNQQLLSKQAVYTLPANTTLNKWLDIKVKGTAPFDAEFATIFVYAPPTSAMTANVDEAQFYKLGDYTDLINGGFEEYTGTNIPVWSLSTNSLRQGTSYIPYTADKPVGGGTASLKMTDNSTASDGEIGLLSNAVIVQEGNIYEAKAKVKRLSGTQTMYIKFYSDIAGTIEIGSYSYGITNAPNWSSFSFQGTAPQYAIRARVLLHSSTTGTSEVLYDDVSFFIKGLDVPHTHGSPISLGKAALSLSIQGGAISSANNEVYFVINGDPGTFYAVNATTGAVNFSQEVPGTTQTWAVVVDSNNKVYFSSVNDGKLWKYDPVSLVKKIELVGTNPAPNSKFTFDLDADANGKLIGSTYSDLDDGRIFEFNTNVSANPYSPLNNGGVMLPGQDYVRGAAVTANYVYAGIGAKRHLIRMNRANQVKEEIPLPLDPNGNMIQGTNGFVHNIWAYNGKLFVLTGTWLIIMNENPPGTSYTTALQIGPINAKISPPSPYNSNLIYYHNKIDNKLWTYNTSTSATALASPVAILPNEDLRAVEWINVGGVNKLALLYSDATYKLYDPTSTNSPLSVVNLNIPEGGITIQSLAKGPDNKLYLGGFIDSMSVFDEVTQTYQVQKSNPESPHQIEEIGFLNGKAFFGTYGGARIYRYDASQPYQYGETSANNPGRIKSIQGQDRPYAFASGDNKLFIGTIPGYGKLGGALITFKDTPTPGSWTESHNDFVPLQNQVQNQSISTLAYKNNVLYGGTSIEGGLGVTPTATSAKLFKWDTVQDIRISESELIITGFTPQLIGHLTFDAAGNLWGGAYGVTATGTAFAIFKMNPSNYSVDSYKLIYENLPRGSGWRGFYLYFGNDGLLYTTIGRYLTVFDPADLTQYTKVVDKTVHLMVVGMNGELYYTTGGTKLYKLPVSQ